MKKRVFSGIQPSGHIHIGNYIGAVRNWLANLEDRDNIFCVVDQHAITGPYDPEALRRGTREAVALYIACGLDPQKCRLFVQSHIPAHTELAWLLTCITPMGWLERMTQFKERVNTWLELGTAAGKALVQATPKQENEEASEWLARLRDNLDTEEWRELTRLLMQGRVLRERVGTGLFTYPTLMAADILLYQAHEVPVGDDQKQHVELTRDIAERFNRQFGEVFTVPEPVIPTVGARIMGLDDPTAKMSKSAEGRFHSVGLLDDPATVRKAIMRAVTDSQRDIVFDPQRPGLYNLLTIYQSLTGLGHAEIEAHFAGKGYGDLKKELAEVVIAEIEPIQARYRELTADPAYIDEVLRHSVEQLRPIADATMDAVRRAMGHR